MGKVAPCGSWKSPITAELAAGAAISFPGLSLDGKDLYWLESRPSEGGRCTVMHRSAAGRVSERTPATFNVRSTVHEYGGGAFTINRGIICFVNYTDQRIYRQQSAGLSSPLTAENSCRYADLSLDLRRSRLLCVQEDHSEHGEPVNTIAAVHLGGGRCQVLVSGNDFYSSPRLSPDGAQLAYLTWNHPNMPWDGCELHLAEVAPGGEIGPGRRIAGGQSEAIFQPEWSPGGALHFASDASGWWNLYRWSGGTTRALCPIPAEFGRAQWSFGYSTYGIAGEYRLLCCYTENGVDHLAWLDSESRRLQLIDTPYTRIDFLRCGAGIAAFVGASPSSAAAVVQMDLGNNQLRVVRPAYDIQIETGYVSTAVTVDWTSPDGQQTQGFYYAPTNQEFVPPVGESPPLIVLTHSGPTSAATSAFRYPLQFWTSRGFAVLDVNYPGSTGYGRAYRRRLNGEWGVVDVEACCGGALSLALRGHVDRARMAIKGGSAGGYTALACLTTRHDVFAMGSVHFAIADLELQAQGGHKFESRYHESLIGPYPERLDLYRARSPLRHVQELRCPLILFHGDDDRVVPPAQSQLMFDAVRRKGLPTALLRFAGEGHGFRRADTLVRALEAEFYFVARIFRFAPQDVIAPVHIENLPD